MAEDVANVVDTMDGRVVECIDELQQRAEREYGDEYTTKVHLWTDGDWAVEVFHTLTTVDVRGGRRHNRHWRDTWRVSSTNFGDYRGVSHKWGNEKVWSKVDRVEIDIEVNVNE